MKSVPSTVTKTYPQRGPLQQFRFADSTTFDCFRCGAAKKSKLITVYSGDWSQRLCNGCYGRLLSLYEIKAGTADGNEKAEELATALLSIVSVDAQRQAERLLRISEKRAERLSQKALRFLSTAEYLAGQLRAEPQLEWSPAVIGLCKALEMEVVRQVLQPLAEQTTGKDLSADKKDKNLGRVAAYCTDPTRKPPELGSFSHFLQAAIHSRERRQTSVLLGVFLRISAQWIGSQWILDPNGLHHSLTVLTTDFRNRAAHIDELAEKDYRKCREMVIGAEGALWKLLLAVERKK